MTVVDLTQKRLERLEKSARETNVHLGHIATILEGHSKHFERLEDALVAVTEALSSRIDGVVDRLDAMTGRIDRLTAAIARGRTQDLIRFDDHDRRIRTLERRRRSK